MIWNRQGFFLPLFKKSSAPDFIALALKKKFPLLFQGQAIALAFFSFSKDSFFLHFQDIAIPHLRDFFKRPFFFCFLLKKKIIKSIEWVFLNDPLFAALHKNCDDPSFFHAYEISCPFLSSKPNKNIKELSFKIRKLQKKAAALSFDMTHLKNIKKNLSPPLPYQYALPMDMDHPFKLPLLLDDFTQLQPHRKLAFQRYFLKTFPHYEGLSKSQILQKMIDCFWLY